MGLNHGRLLSWRARHAHQAQAACRAPPTIAAQAIIALARRDACASRVASTPRKEEVGWAVASKRIQSRAAPRRLRRSTRRTVRLPPASRSPIGRGNQGGSGPQINEPQCYLALSKRRPGRGHTLDRASVYGTESRKFESFRARKRPAFQLAFFASGRLRSVARRAAACSVERIFPGAARTKDGFGLARRGKAADHD